MVNSVPSNGLEKRYLNLQKNMIDLPYAKKQDTRLEQRLPTEKKQDAYIKTLRDKSGVFNPVPASTQYNPNQLVGMNYPQASEYIRENETGQIDHRFKTNEDRTGHFMLPESNQEQQLGKYPQGAPTSTSGNKKGYTLYNATAKQTKKENVKPYQGIGGGGTAHGNAYQGTRQNVNVNNKRHASTQIGRVNPAGGHQKYTRSDTGEFLQRTRNNKQEILLQSSVGTHPSSAKKSQTRVASYRFANDPGVLPSFKTEWRFSPQYSWQVQKDPNLKNKRPQDLLNGRLMNGQFIKPLVKTNPGNWKD